MRRVLQVGVGYFQKQEAFHLCQMSQTPFITMLICSYVSIKMFDVEFQITLFVHNIFHHSTPLGSLPAGTKVEAGADGRVTLGGAKLPQGATVVNNPDGSKSISGNVPDDQFPTKVAD